MSDLVGRTLSHDRILRQVGAGGMGEVYEAEDLKLGRHVALKILPGETAGDPQRRERFEREAKAVAALNHPNIVTLYSSGWIWAPLLDYPPFQQVIAKYP